MSLLNKKIKYFLRKLYRHLQKWGEQEAKKIIKEEERYYKYCMKNKIDYYY